MDLNFSRALKMMDFKNRRNIQKNNKWQSLILTDSTFISCILSLSEDI